jgi:hypothetical protein
VYLTSQQREQLLLYLLGSMSANLCMLLVFDSDHCLQLWLVWRAKLHPRVWRRVCGGETFFVSNNTRKYANNTHKYVFSRTRRLPTGAKTAARGDGGDGIVR